MECRVSGKLKGPNPSHIIYKFVTDGKDMGVLGRDLTRHQGSRLQAKAHLSSQTRGIIPAMVELTSTDRRHGILIGVHGLHKAEHSLLVVTNTELAQQIRVVHGDLVRLRRAQSIDKRMARGSLEEGKHCMNGRKAPENTDKRCTGDGRRLVKHGIPHQRGHQHQNWEQN
ncbi:hypothetical protein DSO57_1039740 [Entomophthora muscae]|uniref:Uncharacterized protein n=1 Tax=Entomophthora muscae TaxID=34485 RepID=A0ACC2SNJ9_9FUNG|nr:hypothetical protein DSO57_1039740 [Entomophthora muscae]